MLPSLHWTMHAINTMVSDPLHEVIDQSLDGIITNEQRLGERFNLVTTTQIITIQQDLLLIVNMLRVHYHLFIHYKVSLQTTRAKECLYFDVLEVPADIAYPR
jgi:hypothetical protein